MWPTTGRRALGPDRQPTGLWRIVVDADETIGRCDSILAFKKCPHRLFGKGVIGGIVSEVAFDSKEKSVVAGSRRKSIDTSGVKAIFVSILAVSCAWCRESPFVRAVVQPPSQAKFLLWKALSGFEQNAPFTERIGVVGNALPAIVEGGKTLLRVVDSTAVCCSEQTEQWVESVELSSGKPDGRRWCTAKRNHQGGNELDSTRAKADFLLLTRLLTSDDSRSLGRWSSSIQEVVGGSGAANAPLRLHLGRGFEFRMLSQGRWEFRKGERLVGHGRARGWGACWDQSAQSPRKCLRDLNLMEGWSDSIAGVVVLRLGNNEGCDGCEVRPQDRVLRFP